LLKFILSTSVYYFFNFWLKKFPDYVFIFCRLILIKNLIEQLFIPLASAIAAQGNIKGYQVWSSILLFFPLTISFILFKMDYPPYVLYLVFIIYSIISAGIILYYTKINCQLSVREFMINVLVRCFVSFVLVFIIALIPYLLIEISFIRLALVILMSTISYFAIVYLVGFSANERLKIKQVGIILIKKVGLVKGIT